MKNFFRYHLQRWKYPALSDYSSMGIGIEARYARCRQYWAKHLQFSKEFQLQAAREARSHGCAVILGAGRLLDVPYEELAGQFDNLLLVDLDPSAISCWKALQRRQPRLTWKLHDVSGSIGAWTAALERELQRSAAPNLSDFLDSLQPIVLPLPLDHSGENAPPGLLVSANLLSQIPIYWRDRVHGRLKDKAGIDTDEHGRYEDQLQAALERSMGRLQSAHLELLSASGADVVVVITDCSFYFYRNDTAQWQVETALHFDEQQLQLNNYELSATDGWLWHLAPQAVEQEEFGEIHAVRAWAFRREG